MKGLLKSEKLREVLRLAKTENMENISLYIVDDDELQITTAEQLEKQIFMNAILKVYPSLLAVDEASCELYKQICSKNLSELKSAMRELVALLPKHLAELIGDFLGLEDDIPLTYVQIANKHNKGKDYIYPKIREAIEFLLQRETKNMFLNLLGLLELTSDNCMFLCDKDCLDKEFHYIQHLPCSRRIYKALLRNKIYTLEQLAGVSEQQLLKRSGIGKGSISELKTIMSKFGISFLDAKSNEKDIEKE